MARKVVADLLEFGEVQRAFIGVKALIGYTYIDPRQTDFVEARDTGTNTSKSNLLKLF